MRRVWKPELWLLLMPKSDFDKKFAEKTDEMARVERIGGRNAWSGRRTRWPGSCEMMLIVVDSKAVICCASRFVHVSWPHTRARAISSENSSALLAD